MRRLLALVLVTALGACVWTETRPTVPMPPPEPPEEPPEPLAKPPAPQAPEAEPEAVPTELPGMPSIRIAEVVGTTPTEAEALFAEAGEPLSQCAGEGAGMLRVRFSSDGVRTKFDVDPTSTLDPEARECALEALSIADLPTEEGVASPSERSPRIESLLEISWPTGP